MSKKIKIIEPKKLKIKLIESDEIDQVQNNELSKIINSTNFSSNLFIQVELLWLDTSIDLTENLKFLTQFESLFNNIMIFTNMLDYRKFLLSSNEFDQENRYYLLISGQIEFESIELANQHSQMNSIFIKTQNVQLYQNLAKQFLKIILVTNCFEEIYQFFKSELKMTKSENEVEVQEIKSKFNFSVDKKFQNYLLISFINKLCTINGQFYRNKDLKDFYNYAKKYINKHLKQIQYEEDLTLLMKDLQITTVNTQIVSWYTKETFFNHLINNTIEKGTSIEIFQIRIAIFELNRQLNELQKTQKNYPRFLYQGILLNKSEFNQWNIYNKYLILLQGFKSLTKNRQAAIEFCEQNYQNLKQQDQQSKEKVLVEIMIDTSNEIILPIPQNPKEEEYLSKLNSLLIIEKIEKDNSNQVNIVKTSLLSFDQILKDQDQQILIIIEQINKSLVKRFLNIELYLVDFLWIFSDWNSMINILNEINDNNSNDKDYIYDKYGQAYSKIGQLSKGLEFSLKALEIRKKSIKEDHREVAISYNNIANIYYGLGNLKSALEFSIQGLDIRRKCLGENNPDTATSYNNVGQIYKSQGDYDNALKFSLKALEILKISLGENHLLTASSYNNIALIYQVQDNLKIAFEFSFKALEIRKKNLGEFHTDTAISYNNIGQLYQAFGKHNKALEFCLKALKIFKKSQGQNHPITASQYMNVGNIFKQLKDLSQAQRMMNKSYQITLNLFGQNHQCTINRLEKLNELKKLMINQEI